MQIFEAMGEFISKESFYKYALPCMKTIADELRRRHPETPLLVFPRGATYSLADLQQASHARDVIKPRTHTHTNTHTYPRIHTHTAASARPSSSARWIRRDQGLRRGPLLPFHAGARARTRAHTHTACAANDGRAD